MKNTNNRHKLIDGHVLKSLAFVVWSRNGGLESYKIYINGNQNSDPISPEAGALLIKLDIAFLP